MVVMLDSSTPYADGAVLFEVTGWEALNQFNAKGAICLLTQATAAPAGFEMDSQGQVSAPTITAGNASKRVTPLVCQLEQFQLGQFRFRPQYLNPDAGVDVDDLSVLAFSGSEPRWSTLNGVGEMNAMGTVPDPVDFALAAAQGSGQSTPVNFPYESSEWERAEPSELWSYFTKVNPGFQLVNRSGAVLGANGTFAWLMRMSGWVYSLSPMPLGDSPKTIHKAGADIMVPGWAHRDEIHCVQLKKRQPALGPS